VQGRRGRGGARQEDALLAPLPRGLHRALAPGAQLMPALPIRAPHRRPQVRGLEGRARTRTSRARMNEPSGNCDPLLLWFFCIRDLELYVLVLVWPIWLGNKYTQLYEGKRRV
jgi:hypothetical protein